MRIAGLVLLTLLLTGCEGVLTGVRLAFPVVMFVMIVGALFYAIYGNRGARRENDRRTPDADNK